MKLNVKKNPKRLIELHLIKSRTYEQFLKKKYIINLSLTQIALNLKKALNIIFKFHTNNKRILFIGTPKIIENKINLTTIHSAIPNSLKIEGIPIANSIATSAKLNQYLFQNKKLFLTKIKKKPELIVIFNHNKQKSIVKESHVAKIPIIEFNTNFQTENLTYNIPGNLNNTKNKIIDNIFIIIFNSLLNKSTNKLNGIKKKK